MQRAQGIALAWDLPEQGLSEPGPSRMGIYRMVHETRIKLIHAIVGNKMSALAG